jgi:hypothetical protein
VVFERDRTNPSSRIFEKTKKEKRRKKERVDWEWMKVTFRVRRLQKKKRKKESQDWFYQR